MTQVIVRIDERLLEEAQRLSGAKTKEEIIELALHGTHLKTPVSGCSILCLWTTCLGGEGRWGFRS
jgi:hypothetical protein